MSDQPIETDAADLLGYGAPADALADLIDDPGIETPLTVAITGAWGSGKTSLARLIERRLKVVHSWPEPHLVCWYNAWLHADTPSPGVALASAVTRAVNRGRPWWRRLMQPAPSAMISPQDRWRRELYTIVVSVLAAAAVVALPATRAAIAALLGTPARLAGAGELAAWLVLAVLFWVTVGRTFMLTTALSRFLGSPREEAARGTVGEVHEQICLLVRQSLRGRRRLVIIVDDLDRCADERALEICEVAAKLFNHPNVVTVLVGDMAPLAHAAERHLAPTSDEQTGSRARGREFLQKLIQVVLTLPVPQSSDVHDLIRAGERQRVDQRSRRRWSLSTMSVAIRRSWDDIVWSRLAKMAILAIPVTGLLLFLIATVSVIPEPTDDSTAGRSGDAIAADIQTFVAPTAAILIALVGLKYVFGETKSLSAFIGFVFLGVLIYALITWGDLLLRPLADVVAGWVNGGPDKPSTQNEIKPFRWKNIEPFRRGNILLAVAGGVVFTLVAGLRIVPGHGARRRGDEIRDEIRRASDAGAPIDEIESQLVQRFGNAETMRRRIDRFLSEESDVAVAAQHAILPLLPRNPRAAKRLVSQLRLTLLIASGRGLMDPDSQVTGEHLARWIVLADRWPEFADRMAGHLTRDADSTTADLIHSDPASEELQTFLRNGPPLDPVMQHIVHLAPRVSPGQIP